jgi:Domain of unknown function (DUF4430)
MKRKTMLTFILAIVGVALIGVGSYFVYRDNASKSQGEITIKVVDLNDVLIKEKSISYIQGDTLVSLVESHFSNVVIENGMIMSIESITTPYDWSTYICIYKNDEMSNVGIRDIEFARGDTVSFVNTVLS